MGNLCCEEESSGRRSHKILKRQSNAHTESVYFKQPSDIEVNDNIPLVKYGPENYQSIKYLGRGTFGDVVLAEEKETMKQYAMKIIEKRKIKELNVLQCQLIKKISQMELFVTIKETFQNETKIYIVMEYHSKGDIYYYLRRKQYIFKEDIIRNLLSQIVVGIEILHNQGIIYRELKPQNILVTNDGHIRLTDYGLSKMIISGKSQIQTFIGTLEYTAPEVFKGNYGKEVDLWAIGILVFQLKFEYNPFENNQLQAFSRIQKNIEKTNIEDILNNSIGLISQQFRDLLIKLLQKNPNNRISIEELKSHNFFDGIVWDDILKRKNQPPLKEFLATNSIKFRDPMEGPELSHRKLLENKHRQFIANLYEFRSSQ